MQKRLVSLAAARLVALVPLAGPSAQAQSTEATETGVPPAKTGWMSSVLSKIGLSAPSIDSVSPSNIPGAPQYCLQKKDGGSAAVTAASVISQKGNESRTGFHAEFAAGVQGTLEGKRELAAR
jgi:hypothetical protein